MIIDSSALLAIILAEPDARRYAQAIASAEARQLPSVAWFEASMRVDAKGDAYTSVRFDDFVHDFRIQIVPFTAEHARIARQARLIYGKPHHPAQLNFGDCLVYGVAKHERLPLLFKGNDFSQTDIEPALKD
ncbi:MAG: type II toxin-antitoxin system VapC family toxin [Rhodospirillales bacterium]